MIGSRVESSKVRPQNEGNLGLNEEEALAGERLETKNTWIENLILDAVNSLKEKEVQSEKLTNFNDVRSWLIYQMKTVNWVNLGIVIVLLVQIQAVQQQNNQNKAQLVNISTQINDQAKIAADLEATGITIQNQLDSSKMILQQVAAHGENLTTNFLYYYSNITQYGNDYLHDLELLNKSATVMYSAVINAQQPKIHYLKSSSGSRTFSCSTNPVPSFLRIRMIGGGGGGSGAGSWAAVPALGNGNGGNGGDTTFGSNFLIAQGGYGGGYVGGSGAPSASLGGNGIIAAAQGVFGFTAQGNSADINRADTIYGLQTIGTQGGASVFGGATSRDMRDTSKNFGAGGVGGTILKSSSVFTNGYYSGAGGGAGGYVEAYITQNIQSSYVYTVGSGGTAGKSQSSGWPSYVTSIQDGSAGGSGLIIVEEWF